MPTIKTWTDVTAGTQNPNVIQGNQFEFLSRPSRVQVYARQDSASTGIGECEVFLSQTLELPQAPVTRTAPAGINVNTDLLVDTFGDMGDRIVVRLVETGGTNDSEVDVMVVIVPVA